MNQLDIRAAIDDFLDLLANGTSNEPENIRALERALDLLALAYHFTDDVSTDDFSEDGQPEPPTQDYDRLRQLAVTRFPKFGPYNVPGKITDQIMETEMEVGDALDDIADIAGDLSKVVWCWEHTSVEDALWHFRFGYEHHWGEHLRNLQLYLYAFRRES